MPATTAEQIAVEIITRIDKAKGDIASVDRAFSTTAASVDTSTRRLETSVNRAATKIEGDSKRIVAAQRNANRQYSDIATQLAGGQSPFLIAAQQAPQLADALQDMGGRAAKVAAFFAGPWGSAILLAGSVLGTALIPHLFAAADASDTMSKEQAELANYVDTTTGAINRQTQAVQRLAAAQTRQKDIESGTRKYAESRGGAINAIREAGGQRAPEYVAGVQVPGSTTTDPIKQQLRSLAEEAARTRRPINDLVLDVRKLVGNRPEYRELVNTITAQGSAAVTAAQGVGRLQAEQRVLTGTATAADRALLGMNQATAAGIDRQVALATATTAVGKAQARLAIVQEQGRTIQAGDTKALAEYRTNVTAATNAVNSAEAAEKAAAIAKRDGAKATREAARDAKKAAREREQAVRQGARAERELLSLQSEYAGAQSDLTPDGGFKDAFARQRITLERDGRLADYQEQFRRKELSPDQLKAREQLTNDITNARLQLVDQDKVRRESSDGLSVAQAQNDASRELLEAQANLATTAAARREIELKLLDLAIQERKLAAQRVVDLADKGLASQSERDAAQFTLDNLPQVKSLQTERINRDAEGPGKSYVRQLGAQSDDIGAAIEGISIEGLDRLNDGLADAITGAKSLGDAFHDVAGSIIQDLVRIAIKQAIIKPLASALFGGGDDAGGGLKGLLGSILGKKTDGDERGAAKELGGILKAGIFGRASGGYVAPGQTVRVNEQRGGMELLRMGSQGGSIIPLGQAQAARPGGGTVIVQPIHADFRGARTDEQTMKQFMAYADATSKQAYDAAVNTANRSAPSAVARAQRYGS